MIPQGWERTTLGRVAKITSGGTPDRNKPEYWGGDIPWVTTGEIGNGPIVSTSEHITEIGLKNSSAKLFPPGTLLMAMYGQGKTRGKVAQLKIEATTNQACAAILTKSAADASFLFQNLTARYDEIRNLSNDGSQKNLSGGLLKALPILLPPPMERESIAAITATWDRAIETVEALIANARAQKQALMQQLLPQGTTPPKERLPGFSGEWREVRLGNLVKEVSRDVEWDDEATYKLISVRRRSEGIFHRESLLGHEILTKAMKVALAGDFLISKMQIVHGASALVKADFDGFNISGSYIALVPKDQATLDIEYFDWYSRTPYFYKLAYISSYGVHIEKMTFNLKSFLKQTILVPPSKAEQSAIVDRLNSAEALIGVYQSQASALRQEKAALMQQLLTGKRRVKLPESPSARSEVA